MKFSLNTIDAIIFDLGGVVLNLDPEKTVNAFADITGLRQSELVEMGNNNFFKQFERGEISSSQFRNNLNELFNLDIENQVMDNAWNAMLLDLPIERLKLIGGLKDKFKTFVLSNTNEIHSKAFDNTVSEVTGGHRIQEYFEEVYYSYKLGMRKPDTKIFELVITKNNLDCSKTLFIDDTLEHIESANQIGLQTWHLTNQEELFTVFDNG